MLFSCGVGLGFNTFMTTAEPRGIKLSPRIKTTNLFEPVWKTVLRVFSCRSLRAAGIRCMITILRDFFWFQYKAALFPGRVPVSQADHPLDVRIPFNPRWVYIYLDFVAYWIRIAGFFLTRYGKSGIAPAFKFINAIEELYTHAAQVYRNNLSTTRRPRYFGNLRFLMIHITDPHLMCIPSLHVMIVIRSYTKFRSLLESLPEISGQSNATSSSGKKEVEQAAVETAFSRALDITQAVLYVKQHSVNCISAAMYAMSCLEPALFPPEEAETFAQRLFTCGKDAPKGPRLKPEDIPVIREYIIGLYHSFMNAGGQAGNWTEPLLRFLENLPPRKAEP
jgi:hypothetical protein